MDYPQPVESIEAVRARKLAIQTRINMLRYYQTLLIDELASWDEQISTALLPHANRVACVAGVLAEALHLPEADVNLIKRAAPLHDIGKLQLPEDVIWKASRLSQDEFDLIKSHTVTGSNMLQVGCSPMLRMASEIALTHHERWMGKGYPNGRQGTEIPLAGRIVAVADVFDALTRERIYKAAWKPERAVEYLMLESGRQFDPQVISVFVEVWRAGGLVQWWPIGN